MRETLLKRLYQQKRLSMAEIAQRLGTTHAAVLYWMKKHGIRRRNWSDSAYIKQNPDGDPFSIPRRLTKQQQQLLVAGLMLYWAEGSKAPGTVKLANLDHRMLRLFARFLREVCRVAPTRLSVYVRVHKAFDRETAHRYWAEQLGLSLKQVFVYPHTDRRSQEATQWSPYGLATLEFHNTRFKQWLVGALEEFLAGQLPSRPTVVREVAERSGDFMLQCTRACN